MPRDPLEDLADRVAILEQGQDAQREVDRLVGRKLVDLMQLVETLAARVNILAAPPLDLGALDLGAGPGPEFDPAIQLEQNREFIKSIRLIVAKLEDLDRRVEARERGFD